MPVLRTSETTFLPGSAPVARLAETLVALANAQGGTLLVGVEPRSGQVAGLADPEEALDRALEAALAADPPLVIPMPRLQEMEGHAVLAVTVPAGLPHVYSFRGKYLVRDGAHNRPLDPRQLRRLMMERGAVSFESLVPDGARLADLDWQRVESYLARLEGLPVLMAIGHGEGPATGREEALLRRGGLQRADAGAELRPTYAGLLLFGREPQHWVPSSEILVARYAGSTMDDRFIKEQVRGTLPDQIRQAEAFVVSNMRRGVRLQGLERVEEPEVPVAAVREAIVNAVAHRDYQVRGDEIRILMFRDRIEFYSPGRLPGHVTVENLVHERYSRNEIVVQVLADMGFIERLGYGIDRMLRLMAQAGLPEPRFAETAGGFQVTLPGRESAPVRGPFPLAVNERQEKALAYLAERGRITNREFQDLCPDVSPETIRRDLADLVRLNLLLKIGEKRATYYILK